MNACRRRIVAGCAAPLILATVPACSPGPLTAPKHAAPMNKPVAINTEEGSGSLEAARRELTGTWDLLALEYAPREDGVRVSLQAKGTLTYDEYGNLTIDAHTTDPAAPVAALEASALSFRGRAVIDPQTRELKMMDLTGNVDPNEVLSPERRRRYEITDGVLTLSSIDAQGRVMAISTWRRRL